MFLDKEPMKVTVILCRRIRRDSLANTPIATYIKRINEIR